VGPTVGLGGIEAGCRPILNSGSVHWNVAAYWQAASGVPRDKGADNWQPRWRQECKTVPIASYWRSRLLAAGAAESYVTDSSQRLRWSTQCHPLN